MMPNLYLVFLFIFVQTVDKLKNELKKSNISIIAVEGFEQLGDVSYQLQKLKVAKMAST